MLFTETRTGPVVAPPGIVATICESLQLLVVAVAPLIRIALLPLVAWKPDPLTVTCVPAGPVVGEMLFTCGGGIVNLTLLPVVTPPTATNTVPLVAAVGTVAVMLESFHAVAVAVTPLNWT